MLYAVNIDIPRFFSKVSSVSNDIQLPFIYTFIFYLFDFMTYKHMDSMDILLIEADITTFCVSNHLKNHWTLYRHIAGHF